MVNITVKCDRCGKIYDHYALLSSEIYGVAYNSLKRCCRDSCWHEHETDIPTIDLCPECMHEFDWFMNPELEKKFKQKENK